MMGVAGVSTRQAIMCIKIAANTLFHQSYILPPSLEREYKKKLKLRRKLAKLDVMRNSTTTVDEITSSRQVVADIICHSDNNEDSLNSGGHDTIEEADERFLTWWNLKSGQFLNLDDMHSCLGCCANHQRCGLPII